MLTAILADLVLLSVIQDMIHIVNLPVKHYDYDEDIIGLNELSVLTVDMFPAYTMAWNKLLVTSNCNRRCSSVSAYYNPLFVHLSSSMLI